MNAFRKQLFYISVLAAQLVFIQPTFAQNQTESQTQKQIQSLHWVGAPTTAEVTPRATIKLKGDTKYLGEADTKKFLKLNGNPERDGHYTIASPSEGWFAIFSFLPEGYVKDDEKIDADALLSSLKESNKVSIEERKKEGIPVLYLDGWYVPPHYDSITKRLEWGVKFHDEQGNPVINYTSRILGRNGYMNAILVSEPTTLDRDVKSYKTALQNFDYNVGENYSEFRQGDKIAEYGLGALVLGGAAAVAAKKGFFTVIAAFFAMAWKWILGAGLLAMTRFKSIFGKKDK